MSRTTNINYQTKRIVMSQNITNVSADQALKHLLKTCEHKYSYKSEIKPSLTREQNLWLVEQSWLRCKLKRLISIQPISQPNGLIFVMNVVEEENMLKVESKTAISATKMYGLSVVPSDFDIVKERLAGDIARALDYMIIEHLPNQQSIDVLLDASALGIKYCGFDYIVGPSQFLQTLKKNDSFDADFYESEATTLSKDFNIIALAGKYPRSMLDPPIFAPYDLVTETGIDKFDRVQLAIRAAWHTNHVQALGK
jgi:hypothetical protein